MQTIKVNIDYGFNDYLVLFELFDENPTEEPEDGSIIKKENIKGLFKASTDKSGRFSGNVTIPGPNRENMVILRLLGNSFPHRTDNQRQKYQLQSKTTILPRTETGHGQ